jgi:hypothetical protein
MYSDSIKKYDLKLIEMKGELDTSTMEDFDILCEQFIDHPRKMHTAKQILIMKKYNLLIFIQNVIQQ